MQNLMLRLGMEEDVPIESKLISKRIEAAQKAVEAQNFAARKHLIEYDDVMNKQRQAVYGMRRQLLEGLDQKERVTEIIGGIVAAFVDLHCPEKVHPSEFDLTGMQTDVLSQFGVKLNLKELDGQRREDVEGILNELLIKRYLEKESVVGPEMMRQAERVIMLNVIDQQWKDHLLSMDHLKEGIGLRGYGQKDPLIEYKKESYVLFQDMMDRIEDETIRYLFFLQVSTGPAPPGGYSLGGDDGGGRPRPILPFSPDGEDEEEEDEEAEAVAAGVGVDERRAAQSAVLDVTRNIQRKKDKEMAALQFAGGEANSSPNKPVLKGKKPGRNDPCSCGSGKKYKKCCGAT